MDFSNVSLEYQNVSNGPETGNIYSIDHTTDTMVVKTYPGGSLVSTITLDANIQNEVLSLEYDGYYWWTLSKIGLDGSLGVVIQKWALEGTTLRKLYGAGQEIVLSNTASLKFNGEAMVVRTIESELAASAVSGTTTISLTSATYLVRDEEIYIGPNISGNIEAHKIRSVINTTVELYTPLIYTYTSGDTARYRKEIWLFNNNNGREIDGGSLVRINSNKGYVEGYSSSDEWAHVSAAKCKDGDLAFIRDSQYLEYRPYGPNAGYQKSILINNIKSDNSTIIKVGDLFVDDEAVYKLQKTLHWFNDSTDEFEDIDSINGKYQIDKEFYVNNIKSITAIRRESVLYDDSKVMEFTAQVLDQYNIPVFGRTLAVSEDDSSGFIVPSYETITTNTSGQAISKYNTGISPNYRIVSIKLTDVVTGQNHTVMAEQIPYIDSSAGLVQEGPVEERSYLLQDEATSFVQLNQNPKASMWNYIWQAKVEPMFNYVLQDMANNNIPITQDTMITDSSYLVQEPATSGYTDINQFVFLVFAIPIPYSIKNQVDTNILVRIAGFGSSVLDPSTLIFRVNGVDITSQVVITPFSGGLELLYNPTANFPYSSRVYVFIQIQDLEIPRRTIIASYWFDTINDQRSPFIYLVFPPDKSINNEVTTQLYVIIKDLETGINNSSIKMWLEGIPVSITVEVIDSTTVKVIHNLSCDLPYNTEITAAIYVEDNEGNSLLDQWSFYTKPGPGILFIGTEPADCSLLVPINTAICSELFGLEKGVNIDTLTFSVDGQKVQYVIKPKVYRAE